MLSKLLLVLADSRLALAPNTLLNTHDLFDEAVSDLLVTPCFRSIAFCDDALFLRNDTLFLRAL